MMRYLGRSRRRKVLAVASGGGHWIQLLRLLPATDGYETIYASVHEHYREQVPSERFRVLPEATRWNKLRLVWLALRVLLLLLHEQPDVVISTGAAPGYLAVRLGKFLGAQTIWVDSIANADELSLSGRMIGPYADLWLTQWPQLAKPAGPHYVGAVL